MILKARFVVPVEGPVIHDGAVAIERGKIVAVGRSKDISGQSVIDYGDAVIAPGFVNAHTHLELSLLAGRIEPRGDLIEWLSRLVALRKQELPSEDQIAQAIRLGIDECLHNGVTTIGDISTVPLIARRELIASTIRGVSYGEVIAMGTGRHRLDERLQAAVEPHPSSDQVRIGISPHAPYTVELNAMRACATAARKANLPLCIHLAESIDEEAFTKHCEGRFVDYLKSLDVFDEQIKKTGRNPVELVDHVGLLGVHTLLAHANYVTPEDIALIAQSDASVAYCPRTHYAFGHAAHPFLQMLKAGINVCLGTDSLASNPSLSLLDEMRFVHREHPNFPPASLMELGTIRGALALGLAQEIGSIVEGKRADLVVVPLERKGDSTEWSDIFESDHRPIATYFEGACVSGNRPQS